MMTKMEARAELQTIILDRWIDFDEWADFQLALKGEWSSERIIIAEKFHREAERKLYEYLYESMTRRLEMKERGASVDEQDAYRRSRWPEQRILVNDWRRLGP
jgi:hypothetical protein